MISSGLKMVITDLLVKSEEEIVSDIKNLKDGFEHYDSKILFILKDMSGGLYNFEYTDIPFLHFNNILDDEIIQDLCWIKEQEINLNLKAKIYDCLWVNTKNYNSAILAYNLYKQIIKNNNDFDKNYYILNRIISIALSLGESSIKKMDLQDSIVLVINQGEKDITAMTLKLMEACLENNLLEIDVIIEICAKRIDLLKDSCNIQIQEGYFNLLERLHSIKFNIKLSPKPINNSHINNIRRLKANMYIDYARKFPDNRFMNINYITRAVNTLKQVDNTDDERKMLLKKLSNLQTDAVNDLSIMKHSFDITEYVDKINNDIEKLVVDEAIFYLSTYPIIQKKQVEKDVIRNAQKHTLSNLFQTKLIDKNGHTKGIVPSIVLGVPCKDEQILIANMEHEVQTFYKIYADGLIKNTLNCICNKFTIDISNIDAIVKNSIFVRKGREKAFASGLLAGFKHDFITALSILIPQLEYSMRCLAEDVGEVVFNINEDGIQEYKTLNALLDLPIINDVIDEDIIFNLKSIFTSKYGMNMRNEISHGNFDDNDFSSMDALYAWWFILKLCYIFTYELYDEKVRIVYNKIK